MTGTGLSVVVQATTDGADAPDAAQIESWVQRVLPDTDGEIVIRIVGADESAALNQRFRGKSGPTNVLAFPPGDMRDPDADIVLLGDIAVCAEIVAREAREQGKPRDAHWAHIVIHACLHLIGYDHMQPAEADHMEARERALLAELGIRDPYETGA